jgi:hypothetical protein
MLKKLCVTILLSLGLNFLSFSQDTDFRETFLTAESYYLFEEFEEALPLYLRLQRAQPDNDNINFKIGVCFLNNPYEKEKSIAYLEKAVKNINLKFKENNFKETQAPLEAHFFLGNAYRVNNQFDKARSSYKKFIELMDPEIYDINLVNEQIAACDAAENLMKKRVDINSVILPEAINTRFSDINPAISGNEKRMVFVSKLQFYDAVFFTERINGNWTPPRNIVPELGVDGDVYPTCLSFDGNEMIVYRSDEYDGNLYTSVYSDRKWSPLVKLNENINTKYWESSGSLSKDGLTLYFSSNRKGGLGGLDIYKSERVPGGQWGPATSLGPVINTKYNDDAPYLTENGQKIFFISYGHYNMGGYDVFMSKLQSNGSWAQPLNLGYPINTSDDNMYFLPLYNGEIAYQSKYLETGNGRHDIYRYEIFSPENPRRFPVTGLIAFMESMKDTSAVNIKVVNKSTGQTVLTTNPYRDGTYRFEIPAGSYDVFFNAERFHEYIVKLDIQPNTPHSGINVPGKVIMEELPKPLSAEELNSMLVLEDTLVRATKPGPVSIRFDAENKTQVVINVYRDSVLISSDTIEATRRKQDFEFTPGEGSNRIEFILTDENGNVVRKTAEVILELPKPVPEPEPEPEPEPKPAQVEPGIIKTLFGPASKKVDSSLEGTLSSLTDLAKGNLKAFLESVDLAKEDITTTSELIEYLYANTERHNYTPDEVNRLFLDASSGKDLETFIAELERVSTGNLKSSLRMLDNESLGISTPIDLVNHLFTVSSTRGFTESEVVASLGILASRESGSAPYLLEALKQNADNDLIAFIDSLTISLPADSTPESVAVLLLDASNKGSFSREDYIKVLTELASSNDPELLRQKLLRTTQGELRALLDTLNLQKNRIYTAADLVDYLYRNPERLDYSDMDVSKGLAAVVNDNTQRVNDLRLKLAALSDGELQQFLLSDNPEFYRFQTEQEFLNYLRDNAALHGYSEQDVNKALLKLSYNGNLDNVVARLSEFTTGKLRETLLDIDLKKEEIQSIGDLISYLTENSTNKGYSNPEVYAAISDYITTGDLEFFRKKLVSEASPATAAFIAGLSFKDNGIRTRQDLTDFLLQSSTDGKLELEEIISLFLAAEKISFNEILPLLRGLSNERFSKLIDQVPEEFSGADQAYLFLLDRTGTPGSEDRNYFNNIFRKYLENAGSHLLYKKLLENATGNLINALAALSPANTQNYDSSWLIAQLFERVSEYGYTTQDVFELLANTMSREDLKIFIEKMKQFASSALLKALKELDLAAMGIETTDELLEYLALNAEKYGYDEKELWRIIEKLAINKYLDEYTPDSSQSGAKETNKFRVALLRSSGVLGLLGLAIIFLIYFKRRKKEQKTDSNTLN